MNSLLLAATLLASTQDEPGPPRSWEVGAHSGPVVQLTTSPDGSIFYSAARGELHAWTLGGDRPVWEAQFEPGDAVALVAGEKIVCCNFGYGKVKAFHAADGATRQDVHGPVVMQRSYCLAVDPEDRWVWIGTNSGQVARVLPDDNLKGWHLVSLDNGGTTCLALDAKGKTLAVGGGNGIVRFIDTKSPKIDKRKMLEGHPAAVSAIAMDAKGAWVVSGSEAGDLRVWKVASGREKHLLEESGSPVRRIAIDPAGKRIASGTADGRIKIWDLAKGELLLSLDAPGGSAVTGLAFLNGGEVLATAGAAPKVTMWDLSEI